MAIPPASGVTGAAPPASPARRPQVVSPAIREAARQFEATFLAEMLRQARPQPHAAGRFAAGDAEKTCSVFMDQALGEAAAAQGASGLRPQIEQALGAAAKEPRT